MKLTENSFFFSFIELIRTKLDKKRQIYREQVQPHTGGRIPDSAFETDRLLLNRLQKEGIAVPDGVIFEQRNPKVKYTFFHGICEIEFSDRKNRQMIAMC